MEPHPFEIQLRSTIQDSWSKIDHHINYKKDVPQQLKRRIYRLAALFELADQEFRLIRDERTSVGEPKVPPVASVSTPEAAKPPAGFEANDFVQLGIATFGKYPFDNERASAFVAEVCAQKHDATAAWMAEVLTRHADEIRAYKEYQRTAFMATMNPYTYVRHALYAEAPTTFRALLFPRQINSFEDWRKMVGEVREMIVRFFASQPATERFVAESFKNGKHHDALVTAGAAALESLPVGQLRSLLQELAQKGAIHSEPSYDGMTTVYGRRVEASN